MDCLSPREDDTPDPEERRRRLEDAATKRQRENESRGLKDPAGVQRKKQKREALEKDALRADQQGGGGLKWTV